MAYLQNYRNLDLKATTGSVVRGAPSKLLSIVATNHTASPLFLKIYNKVAAPASTDTPVLTFELQAAVCKTIPIPSLSPGSAGLDFPLGIGARASTAVADSDNTDPAANSCVFNCFFVGL